MVCVNKQEIHRTKGDLLGRFPGEHLQEADGRLGIAEQAPSDQFVEANDPQDARKERVDEVELPLWLDRIGEQEGASAFSNAEFDGMVPLLSLPDEQLLLVA
jgi:hypothetical protein